MGNTTTVVSHSKLTPVAASVGLAIVMMAQAASAQETSNGALGSVIITANKRVEKLESVPMAISVIDEAKLSRSNVREIEDLANISPAITVTAGSTASGNTISMRGIGTASASIGIEADVAVIIDDIPFAQQFQAFRDLSDILRVEVLKGPQSTLFGKSSVAGAINIITRPISGPVAGKGSMLYSSDGEWRYSLSYGGEISEKLGARVSASKSRFGGNLTNLTMGTKANGSGGESFVAQFAWSPSRNLDITFSPAYGKQFNSRGATAINQLLVDGPNGRVQAGLAGANPVNPLYFIPSAGVQPPVNSTTPNAIPASVTLAGIVPGPNNTLFRHDALSGTDSTDRHAGLKIVYTLPNDMTLMSLTSYTKYLGSDYSDNDRTAVPTVALPGQTLYSINVTQSGTYDIRSRTQEVRLVSPDSDVLKYVVGLWYANNNTLRFFRRGDCAAANCTGSSPTSPVVYETDVFNTSKALFGQATWNFLPTYSLLLGLRANSETSGYHFGRNYNTHVTQETFVPGVRGVDYFESLGNNERKVTGKMSLAKQFNADWMGYVTTATGYKGLAYGLLSTMKLVNSYPVQSETSRTTEVGVKANLFKNHMTLNVAAFNTGFYNYQSSSTFKNPGDPTIYTQISSVPELRSRGLEVDINAMLAPSLTVGASMAYTDATVQEWTGGSCYNDPNNLPANANTILAANGSIAGKNTKCFPISPGSSTGVQDLHGASMQSAPKYRVVLTGQYDLALPAQSFNMFFTGNYRYQSDMNTTITQDPTFAVPAFQITDIGFGIRDKKDRYKLSFLVNNVFDKHYALTGFNGATYTGAKSAPATAYVTTWMPARDAFRFVSAKLDVRF